MNKIPQISFRITAKISESFGDMLSIGNLSIIRGIIESELEKHEEFKENPLRHHWQYSGTHE